jgi:hypothetical protein
MQVKALSSNPNPTKKRKKKKEWNKSITTDPTDNKRMLGYIIDNFIPINTIV